MERGFLRVAAVSRNVHRYDACFENGFVFRRGGVERRRRGPLPVRARLSTRYWSGVCTHPAVSRVIRGVCSPAGWCQQVKLPTSFTPPFCATKNTNRCRTGTCRALTAKQIHHCHGLEGLQGFLFYYFVQRPLTHVASGSSTAPGAQPVRTSQVRIPLLVLDVFFTPAPAGAGSCDMQKRVSNPE